MQGKRLCQELFLFRKGHRIRLPILARVVNKRRLIRPCTHVLHSARVVTINEDLMTEQSWVALRKASNQCQQERRELFLRP